MTRIRFIASNLLAFSFVGGCASTPTAEPSSAPQRELGAESARRPRGTVSLERSPASARPAFEDDGQIKRTRISAEERADGDAKTISINLAQISKDFGIPAHRLERQGRQLALYLNGKKGAVDCRGEDDESTEKLCEMIDRLSENKGSAGVTQNSAGRRVPIRPQFFRTQQNMGYDRLVKSLGREPANRVLAWVPKMLVTTSCPRNLSAAALRRIETLLPSSEARRAMETLYDHAAACLQPGDDGYEITHFRQALLRKLWGDEEDARASINRAVIATNSDEKSRVLYWAGALQTQPALRDKYWAQVVQDYPLSYHALEVWQHRSVDPFDIFSRRPAGNLDRKVMSQNEDAQESLYWLETLYVLGFVDQAQKLARWSSRVYKEDYSNSNLLYIAALKSRKGTPLNSITFLTRQIGENPEIINQATLKMLFPTSYFDVFDRNSPNTDTFLMMSVARQESGFNPRARSRANARGLLQLLPSTARILSGRRNNNLYDTELNAKLGAKFLSNLIEQFGSVELALAAYNAGPGRIPEWKDRYPTRDMSLFLELIPFKETRGYVTNIVRNNYWYERIYRNDPSILLSGGKSSPQRSELVARLVNAHVSAGKLADGKRLPASTTSTDGEL